MSTTIKREWDKLDGIRRSFLDRCMKYAGLTLPIICPPLGYDENSDDMETDYQSIGAQAVNNLANKLVLALFAPSRPFFRFDVPDSLKQKLTAGADPNDPGALDPQKLDGLLSVAEKKCMTFLEQNSTRPKLYQGIKHLIVTGNCLMVLPYGDNVKTGEVRIIGIKNYVVKRNQVGKVICIIVKECVCFNELGDEVQTYLMGAHPYKYSLTGDLDKDDDKEVEHYVKIQWDSSKKKYVMDQAVDEFLLPHKDFGAMWPEEKLPYRAETWDLADDNNYGSGLVEQCSGDFEAISTLSEAGLQAAVLASEFRWLVNPGGSTSVQDFQDSNNGDAIAGLAGDITPLNNGATMNLQPMQALNSEYINRIGKTFLLLSSVIRDAERVTTVEIRAMANELETSLGGVYSRLAVDLQKPIAMWLIMAQGVAVGKNGINPIIITGLDALSRNGDLENLQQCLADMAQLASVPPLLLQRLKLSPVIAQIFSARGLNPDDYVKDDATAAAEQAQQMQQQAAMASAPGVAQEAAKGAVAAQQPQGQ